MTTNTTHDDLYHINNGKIKDEINNRIVDNVLLYPIAKAFLEKFPQYYDPIRTYEHSVESISDMISKESILNDYIKINDTMFANFKFFVDNVRVYSPDSYEAYQYSNFGYVPTPNAALSSKALYSAVIVGDINYSYTLYHKQNQFGSFIDILSAINDTKSNNTFTNKIPNGYIVNMPIPIGCKWCSLRHYDDVTLKKSAEEMKGLYGFFIIDGYIRYILPLYKKPFNKPIILKNNFDEQLSRTEVLYTKGYEYESSYYIIGAMVTQKSAHTGRGGTIASPPDFGFSLQLNHPAMNCEVSFVGKKSKKLINFVPIKYLFCAFGCVTDDEMIKYICPQMNDFGLINIIRQACLQGYKHREALKLAVIKHRYDQNYIAYEEPLTEFAAKYIIGVLILSTKTKEDLLLKCNNNENDYKNLIVQTVSAILDKCFMPGIGDNSNVDRNTAVCVELGMIIKELYLIGYGLETSQDKTSLTNRRIRTGQQMTREFKAFHGVRLREVLNEVKAVFQSNKDSRQISEILQTKMYSIAKNISIDQSRSLINAFKGTSKEQSKLHTELLVLKNQAFCHNKLREIVISSELKSTGSTVSWEHRTAHQSELFFICPAETPEAGTQTGRFKTPTLYTYITLSTTGENILKIIQSNEHYINSIKNVNNPSNLYVIRLNGNVVGYIPQYEPVEKLYAKLMDARLTGEIEIDATIVMNHTLGKFDIWTDTGRIVSPFVIAKNCFDIKYERNKKNPLELNGSILIKPEFKQWLDECASDIDKYFDGFKHKFIEYLDPEMAINNAIIAPCLKEFIQKPSLYSHVALPSQIYGIIASLIPALNCNTAVRVAYVTNHVKQAIGPVLRYPQLKYIGENNILINPQIPIVRPCAYDYLHMNETPYGNNVIVAFMQYKYNQEDSIIMNRASVEQGLLKIDSLVTKDYKIDKNDEYFKVSTTGITLNGNPDSYSKLDQNTALPKNVGEIFYKNDVLIGKVIKTSEGEIDTSILNERPDGKYPPSANTRPLRCIVKNKFHNDNKVIKKCMFGQYRVPIVGDKFNSEHAQKGTCGKIIDSELMPYNSVGMRPDIIFNPPTIFERKTYGHIYISILAKIAALLGCQLDCTPFHTIRNDDELFEILHELGLNDAGYETMYDAETGRPFKSRIFFANHYWERQNHLVEEKLNIRNGGPRCMETGLALKGKRNSGGQSSDRMSFDSHTSAGVCELMRDLHINQGAKIKIGICNRCNSVMGYYHKEKHEWICPRCGGHDDFIIREVPPATLLLNHVFNGLHVAIDYYEHVDSNKLKDVNINE